MPETLVDPRVARTKFDREVALFRQLERDYVRRGWWVLGADFPEVHVVFASPKVTPPIVVFGALLDFTNYDLWPPSVKIVHPFTRAPYKFAELPTPMPRRVAAAPNPGTPTPAPTGPTGPTTAAGETQPTAPQAPPSVQIQLQPLMQSFNPDDPDDVPFVCLPGVKEYHDNPAHSGDSWLLHRGSGEGTLHFILDQLDRYGLQPVRLGFQITRVDATAVLQISGNEVST